MIIKFKTKNNWKNQYTCYSNKSARAFNSAGMVNE